MKKGFTLIELLIVITIIGILAVSLLPSVLGAPARARDAARKADLSNIILALEAYSSDNQHYPDTGGCVGDIADNGAKDALDKYFQGNNPPKDPQNVGPSGTACKDSYVYCPLTVPGYSYYVAAAMEIPGDGNAVGANDIGQNPCDSTTVPTIQPTKPATADVFVIIK